MGKPALATLVSLGKQVIFYVPAMLILASLIGIDGILWAGPISEFLAFVLGGGLMIREIRRLDRHTTVSS
ncbi:MAG: hypothetical protein MR991_01535 [Clostridiales bacterium]|nr:hypothetical protein [Clostridiales bacterium]MDD7035503.1 hypothetical protein [Bacillota bacterium]MDY2919914.1 hypothetical protein [Lentihominibacter sp.]